MRNIPQKSDGRCAQNYKKIDSKNGKNNIAFL